MAAAHFGEQPSDQGQCDRRQQTQRHAAGRLARFAADLVFEPLGIGEQRFHLREQALAQVGQLDAASGAVEQARGTFALERVELAAEQRLIAVEKQRRACQAAELADRHEGTPLVQVGGEVEVEVAGFGRLHRVILRPRNQAPNRGNVSPHVKGGKMASRWVFPFRLPRRGHELSRARRRAFALCDALLRGRRPV
jgi:hypothetical protein